MHTGDLLVGMDGEFNIARWKSRDALLNQRVCKLTAKENVDEEYLRFALLKALKVIENKTAFVTVKHLSAKELNKLELNVPSYEEQKEISKILVKIENLIALYNKELFDFDIFIRARFVEMFGDEKNFDLWTCCTVEDIAEVCVGVVIKPSQYYTEEENGIRAFRSLNVGCMNVKDSDWVYFTEKGHAKNQKSIIRENDVLVVRSGMPGTACVVTSKFAGSNAVDIIIAHPNTEKVNPVFLAMYTNMPHGMNQIRERTGGAAQQHFNVGGYKALKIIMPPLKLQEEFAVFVKQVDKSKVTAQKALEKIQLLFDSLMQQYFG